MEPIFVTKDREGKKEFAPRWVDEIDISQISPESALIQEFQLDCHKASREVIDWKPANWTNEVIFGELPDRMLMKIIGR